MFVAVGLAACGSEAQDADEPEGTWKVDVLSASFPGNQHLAEEAQLKIRVKNVDDSDVPNLAVSVDGFGIREEDRNFSDPDRPIWVVEQGPTSAETGFTDTWSVGKLPPGQTRTLVWRVSAVRPGTYTLRYRVSAGLHGKAKATLPDGSAASGSFIARVSPKPRPVNID